MEPNIGNFFLYLIVFGAFFFILKSVANKARELKIRELIAIGRMCGKTERETIEILEDIGVVRKQ